LAAICSSERGIPAAQAQEEYAPGIWHYRSVAGVDTTVKSVRPGLTALGQTTFTAQDFENGVELVSLPISATIPRIRNAAGRSRAGMFSVATGADGRLQSRLGRTRTRFSRLRREAARPRLGPEHRTRLRRGIRTRNLPAAISMFAIVLGGCKSGGLSGPSARNAPVLLVPYYTLVGDVWSSKIPTRSA
jgi:hypothetical protein